VGREGPQNFAFRNLPLNLNGKSTQELKFCTGFVLSFGYPSGVSPMWTCQTTWYLDRVICLDHREVQNFCPPKGATLQWRYLFKLQIKSSFSSILSLDPIGLLCCCGA
jgi:hypothetical protein